MKRQSILLVLLLLQVLLICSGCGSSDKAAESPAAAAQEADAVTEEAAVEEAAPAEAAVTEAASEEPALDEAAVDEAAVDEAAVDEKEVVITVEDVIGTFEGLEDNHTAIFSFDGAEEVFFFEDPEVQTVLYEAVLGSSYTLSYSYDDSLGFVIYKISE